MLVHNEQLKKTTMKRDRQSDRLQARHRRAELRARERVERSTPAVRSVRPG